MIKIIFVVLALAACSLATNVSQCKTNKPIKDLTSKINIHGCNKLPCKLKKDTFLKVEMAFTPAKDITGLKNHVTADILGAQLPFVGVDGADACNNVYKSDGTKVGKCELKAGEEYVYKNGFEILKIYPSLRTTVHWALVDPDGSDQLCFEVPIRIV